jgi:predicted transcriptional regulator
MDPINDLRSSANRRRIHDKQIVVKLPAEAKDLISKAAEGMGVSDSAVVRLALAEYLERRGYRA